MGLLDRIKSALTGDRISSPEHLEGYQRLGQELYAVEVELANAESPKARAYLRAAKCFQVMADALLRDAYDMRSVPIVTHEQADEWYGRITELMIAARQENAFSGSASLQLPVRIGRRAEGPGVCPQSHLIGMRRAADEVENLLKLSLERARIEKDRFKVPILLYEEARTRRQVGDAIVGSITGGRRVPEESHEEAEDQYWSTLSQYLLAAQGLDYPDCLLENGNPTRRCKLDLDDIWKATSDVAKAEIRQSREWRTAEADLAEFWATYRPTEEEREYEIAVEDLLRTGRIRENGYWYCCPFQSVYEVMDDSVYLLGRRIPRGHVFVWEYGDNGLPGRFITQSSFTAADSRLYYEDD